MRIYTEIEDDCFVFSSENVRYDVTDTCFYLNNENTPTSVDIQEIPILDKVYRFCFPYWCNMPIAPIKLKNGYIKKCNYSYSSASAWVNSILVMLNTLGYKSYGKASRQLLIEKDIIHLPVITTNSNSSIYIEIERTKENIDKIDFSHFLRAGSVKVYDAFTANAREMNEKPFIPFIHNGVLLVKVANIDGGYYFITTLENGLSFLIKNGYKQSYLYTEVIKVVSNYLESSKTRGCKCQMNKYICSLKRCRDWRESDLIFCDFLNLLIQKNIINNKLTLR